jgi:glucan 1,3-beta-glucosidase
MKFVLSLALCLAFVVEVFGQSYWYETITKRGVAPYNSQGSAYQVFRNVKSFGAKGRPIQILSRATAKV